MSTMATKVKLVVGQPATVIRVTEAVEVEGNYGPQARITGTYGDDEAVTLYEKLESVNRQLARCGLDLEGAIGQTLKFWKETATNASGQSFPALRIEQTDIAPAPAKPAPKPAARTAQPTTLGGPLSYENVETGAPPATRAVVAGDEFALYSRCLDRALQEAIRVGLDKLGGDIAGAVVASAATLYIQANKR